MSKKKCIVLFCEKIEKIIIDYYNSIDSTEHDIVIVSPIIDEKLNKKYPKIIFYNDDFFLKFNGEINNTHRPNWYYQQFLKYSIVLKLNYDLIHIIDGDSFLNSKYFFNSNFHYSSIKPNLKYQNFTNIFTNKLYSSKNYIVNHMVFEKKYLLEMFDFFGVNERNFITKFCSKLKTGDFWFSEYQNYAMFMLLSDKKRKSIKTKVFRRLDLINNKNISKGLRKYSLLAFEDSHDAGLLRVLRAKIFYNLNINLG
jgi:hypothetical protein